jgi:hypothetical protein
VLDTTSLKVPPDRIRKLSKVFIPELVRAVIEVVPAVFKLPLLGEIVTVTLYSPLAVSKSLSSLS